MSSADCPKCSGPRDAKALYCPFCGVIFARFAAAAAAVPVAAAVPAADSVFAPAQAFGKAPTMAGGAFDDTFPLPAAQTVYGGAAPAGDMGWNPYQSPNATPAAALAPVEAIADYELAGRGRRLVAQILNGLGLGATLVLVCTVAVVAGVALPEDPSDTRLTFFACLGFALWALVNLRQLSLTGQSLGKKQMGIRILKITGEKPTLANLIVTRYLSMQILAVIPKIGPFTGLFDVLLIFGDAQRCLHDRIAGTVVVKA